MNRYPRAGTFARRQFPSLLVVLPLLAVAAASPGRPASAQDAGSTTLVGFVNGTPDAPPVDIYVDGELEVEALAYGQSSAAVEIPAGRRMVAVTEAGEEATDALVETDFTLERGGAYVIANVDVLADIGLRFWRVDLSPAGEGEARLRVIHASPDAPEVDVAIAGGDVLIAGATFDHAPDPIEVPATTYDLEMRPAGSTDVVQTIQGVTLPAATACTVLALGLLNDDGQLEIATIFTPLNLIAAGGAPSTGVGTAAPGGRGPVLADLFAALAILGLVAAAGRWRAAARVVPNRRA
jgi:hypothetical protein